MTFREMTTCQKTRFVVLLILALVAGILVCESVSNAETLPPWQNNSAHQSVSFKNLTIDLFTANYPKETWSYKDQVFTSPEHASAELRIQAVQSPVRGYCVPWDQNLEVYSSKENMLTVEGIFSFLFTEEEHNWTEPGENSFSINFNDLNLHTNLRTEHDGYWTETSEEEWTFFPNNNVNSELYADISQTKLNYASVYICDYSVQSDEQVWNGITIRTYMHFDWTGDTSLFEEFFPHEEQSFTSYGGVKVAEITTSVPEPPTTVIVLTGLSFLFFAMATTLKKK